MLTIVIGGGVSGLTCAFELRQAGVPVLLLEQSHRVGGVIESVEQNGCLFELGPQSILGSEALLDLVARLGLNEKLLKADPRAARYVYLRGRLERVPMAPPGLLRTSLLGPGTKLRMLAEPFRRSVPREPDESVADFVRRKFGGELLENLVAPFVSGVYAGDTEKLSLRSAFPMLHELEKTYGSVIRGAIKSGRKKAGPRPTLCSFQGGLATLMRALHTALKDGLRINCAVESIRRSKANGSTHFDVQVRCGRSSESLTADALVVAAPAGAAGTILAPLSAAFPELLSRIPYAPVAVVSGAYRREHIGHPLAGFGFLVPRKAGLRVLGTVWSSSLFPGRAPEGVVTLASFAGGATDPALLEQGDARIGVIVEKEIAPILQARGGPEFRLVQRYAQAIPQYNLGHSQILASLREEAARFPGLFLAGSYLEGPAVPACIEQAQRAAKAVQDYLGAHSS